VHFDAGNAGAHGEVQVAVTVVVEGLEGMLAVARRASGEGEIELAVADEDRQRAAREVRGGEVEVAVLVPVADGDPARAPSLGKRHGRLESAVASTAYDVGARAAVRHRQVVKAVAVEVAGTGEEAGRPDGHRHRRARDYSRPQRTSRCCTNRLFGSASGLPGSSADLSTRALLSHPGWSCGPYGSLG